MVEDSIFMHLESCYISEAFSKDFTDLCEIPTQSRVEQTFHSELVYPTCVATHSCQKKDMTKESKYNQEDVTLCALAHSVNHTQDFCKSKNYTFYFPRLYTEIH